MTVVVPLLSKSDAVIVAVPAETPSTSPELETDATLLSDEDQVTDVSLLDVPSSYPPTAVNCRVFPTCAEAVAGLMATDVSFGSTQKSPQEHSIVVRTNINIPNTI